MALIAMAAGAAAIAQKVQEVTNKINESLKRGVVVHLENRTNLSLVLTEQAHDSGAFVEPPDPTIPPNHASVFGSSGGLSLGPAAAGRVMFRAEGVDLSYHVSWEVPLIGENVGNSRCDGGAREYFQAAHSVGGFAQAIAKFDLGFRQLQNEWRRCARCACLNHQAGGLDATCVQGTTHDNAGSRDYALIANGTFGVNPFVANRCRKCACVVSIPGTGVCAAGGVHEPAETLTVVSQPGAPGESGWRICLTCLGFVIDASRPCPSGGAHVLAPAPVFTFWG